MTALVWWAWAAVGLAAAPIVVVVAWVGAVALGHLLAAMHEGDLP